MSLSKTEFTTYVRSCAATYRDCDGVVYLLDIVLDLILTAIGSFRGWIYWIGVGLVEAMGDLVQLAIGSWSPL